MSVPKLQRPRDWSPQIGSWRPSPTVLSRKCIYLLFLLGLIVDNKQIQSAAISIQHSPLPLGTYVLLLILRGLRNPSLSSRLHQALFSENSTYPHLRGLNRTDIHSHLCANMWRINIYVFVCNQQFGHEILCVLLSTVRISRAVYIRYKINSVS